MPQGSCRGCSKECETQWRPGWTSTVLLSVCLQMYSHNRVFGHSCTHEEFYAAKHIENERRANLTWWAYRIQFAEAKKLQYHHILQTQHYWIVPTGSYSRSLVSLSDCSCQWPLPLLQVSSVLTRSHCQGPKSGPGRDEQCSWLLCPHWTHLNARKLHSCMLGDAGGMSSERTTEASQQRNLGAALSRYKGADWCREFSWYPTQISSFINHKTWPWVRFGC